MEELRNYTQERLRSEHSLFFAVVRQAEELDDLRFRLSGLALHLEADATQEIGRKSANLVARIQDCSRALRNILKERSDRLAGFSLVRAIRDIGAGRRRGDLTPAFLAELHHIFLGIQGKGPIRALDDIHLSSVEHLHGREAAIARSAQLDELRLEVDRRIAGFAPGFTVEAVAERARNRERILAHFGGSPADWQDWRWQIKHIVRSRRKLGELIELTEEQEEALKLARKNRLPFGITPYYLSLMDREPGRRDAAIRAQVLPTLDYVEKVIATSDSSSLDFMGEEDTSPFELITRRYPAILILKPFNTCPQICIYCQRNWEIDDVMAVSAYAGRDKVNAAIDWIRDHPAIHEVLVTGGDPLGMSDATLDHVLSRLAAIDSVERIRIGTRTPVTMPMRITDRLVAMLGRYRRPGRREIAVTTHVQHPYEVTPELTAAVDRIRRQGIGVYNQLVYTFFVSRRFEASALRRCLRLAGIDPYYTFNTKGKDETNAFRVPIARLLQEQMEEARLLPGLERTDEAVFNVPRQGKNYLKSKGHRDLLSILPDGSRVYEFHPWERGISRSTGTYVYHDVPILDYLARLELIGEDVADYDTIWFYY
ncbi:MAG: KamA family radical SAM protein [Thermodesulfobacteriota bacterium]